MLFLSTQNRRSGPKSGRNNLEKGVKSFQKRPKILPLRIVKEGLDSNLIRPLEDTVKYILHSFLNYGYTESRGNKRRLALLFNSCGKGKRFPEVVLLRMDHTVRSKRDRKCLQVLGLRSGLSGETRNLRRASVSKATFNVKEGER